MDSWICNETNMQLTNFRGFLSLEMKRLLEVENHPKTWKGGDIHVGHHIVSEPHEPHGYDVKSGNCFKMVSIFSQLTPCRVKKLRNSLEILRSFNHTHFHPCIKQKKHRFNTIQEMNGVLYRELYPQFQATSLKHKGWANDTNLTTPSYRWLQTEGQTPLKPWRQQWWVEDKTFPSWVLVQLLKTWLLLTLWLSQLSH